MIYTNLKIAFRNIVKHKVHTAINVVGLAIGFTAFILVSLFINYESGWDKHNVNYDRVFRVQRHFVTAKHALDGNDISPHTRGITAKVLCNKYPEFEVSMVMKELNGVFLSTKPENSLYDNKEGIAAEQSIFNIFSYHFTEGNMATSLIEPYAIVLSETMAHKFFGNTGALGKTMLIEKKFNLKVTGVYEDLPENSTIRPAYIISGSTLEKRNEDFRNSYAGVYMTFVMLKPNLDYQSLNKKIGNLFKGYTTLEGEKIQLCPLSKLRFSFNDRNDYKIVLSLFRLIGIFMLLLAAFNYINLTTANTAIRAKEIGVRKVHGSPQGVLMIQFLFETLILAIIGLNLAFFLTELTLPVFNNIVQKHLVLSYTHHWGFIGKMTLMALITGTLAGIYPAFFMSSQKVVLLFKGNVFKGKRARFSLKKVLVMFQFAISIFLIISSMIIALQIRYMLNKDLGLNIKNVYYASLNVTRKNANFADFRNRILQHSEITDCAMAEHVPFASFGGGTINWEGAMPGEVVNVRYNTVGYDFINHFGIKMIEGRGFSRSFPSDAGKACIINETAMHNFGFTNPIGKRLDDNKFLIVGVVKDYYYKDMYNNIEPAVLILISDSISNSKWAFSFQIAPGQIKNAQGIIKAELESYFPDDPFELHELYEAFRTENVFKVLGSVNNSLIFFTLVNLFLAVIGLLGLVSFTLQRRTKEIGIRKITGSSSTSVFILLTKEYMVLLAVASVIAWPFGYLEFVDLPGADKMPLPYWLFLFSTVVVFAVILLTSLYHTMKTIRTSPIEALKYE